MIKFSNFQQLDPAARDVASELLANAENQRHTFMGFIYRWIAFNAWMSAVTLKSTDREMIDSLVAVPRLIEVFDRLMADDQHFQQMVADFAAKWPVLNVSSVRAKLGYDAFCRYDREALLALCATTNMKQQPIGWIAGAAPNWGRLLRTIYHVRCNLFHGEKSPQSLRDHTLVSDADRVLAHFIATTRCFEWH